MLSGLILTLALLSTSYGQVADFCRDSGCTDCPVSAISIEPYPVCAVYDSGTSLTDNYDPPFNTVEGGGWQTWWNIENFTPDCATIVRSPANVDEVGCGAVIGVYRNPVCASLFLKQTYMVQSCCGTDDCNAAAGTGRSINNPLLDSRSLSGKLRPVAIIDENGIVVAPQQVDYPVDYDAARAQPVSVDWFVQEAEKAQANVLMRRITVPDPAGTPAGTLSPLMKRDCGAYQETRSYTASGDSRIVSDFILGPGSISASGTQEVSQTTSFETSVGDPFGIISVTVGFEFTTSTSSTLEYTIDIAAGETAAVAWTPTLRCTEGILSDCDDDATYTGNACTAAVNSAGQAIGFFTKVGSS